MKSEQKSFQQNFKIISKDFIKDFEKQELWLLYEYCDYDHILTLKILQTQKRLQLRNALTNYLKNTESGEQQLKNITEEATFQLCKELKQYQIGEEEEKSYWFDGKQNNQFQKQQQQQQQQVQLNEEQQQQIEPGIITKVSEHIILLILEFLNPFEITRFSVTCKSFLEYKSKPLIFKKYCIVLYQNVSQLPSIGQFEQLRSYIISHPSEFHPNLIQRASDDIRRLVWGSQIEQYRSTPQSYYKQFLNWQNMYFNAARIHFSGVYRIKEKYIKIGERDLKHQYAPLIEIKYNRYFRFFPGGKFRYAVTVNKLTIPQMVRIMKDSNEYEFYLEGKKEAQKVMIGEYLKQKDFVIAKFPQGSSIFEFQMQIRSSDAGHHDLLLILQQNMHQIDANHTYTTNIFKYREGYNTKTFKYKHIPELRQDLGDSKIALMTH